MTGLEIALLIVGVLFFIGSFFFVEKLSSSDIETIEKMSEKEIHVLLDKQIEAASGRMEAALESKFNESLNKFDRETNKRTTDEIYSITEHADTVCASLDTAFDAVKKSHDEIMFLYNMLSDKQEKVTELERDAQGLESTLRNMKRSIEDAIERLETEQQIHVPMPEPQPAPAITVESLLPQQDETTLIEAFEKELAANAEKEAENPAAQTGSSAPAADANSINDRILSMHREGYSDVDIAKSLGKGIGEIKLVLGLYEDDV